MNLDAYRVSYLFKQYIIFLYKNRNCSRKNDISVSRCNIMNCNSENEAVNVGCRLSNTNQK